ncbi:MAG: SDR family NAD(P)-dependent oxidoreductase [Polyangiales bacterium]
MRAYHAVVTGAGSGIGRAFAVELGRRGSAVLVTDVDEKGAQETVELVKQAGGRAHAVRCDVSKLEDVEHAAEVAERLHGPTDLCINNAGVMIGGNLGEIPIDHWRFIVGVNLWGTIHGAHVFTPRFKANGGGKFLNVASISGIISTPETAPYNTTKAAIIALSETMAAELGKFGITTTVLCPTGVRTNIFNAMQAPEIQRKLAVKAASRGKARTPEEVAKLALAAADRGDIYLFPQIDGKVAWAIKRFFPTSFVKLSREARNREWMEKLGGS